MRALDRRVTPGLLLAGLLCGCAGDDDVSTTFDESGGTITVTLADPDWVRVGSRRLPLDLFILEMRQRTRALAPEATRRLIVHILVAPEAPEVTARAVDRLVQELGVTGIRQIRYL